MYDSPNRITYTRSIATTTTTWAVAPPLGCTRARLVDISVSATTTYNAVTTSATVGVGVSGAVNVLGVVTLGTVAGGASIGFGSQFSKNVNPSLDAGVLGLGGSSNTVTDGTHPVVTGPILITFTANTGGTPAGAGIADVTIDWY